MIEQRLRELEVAIPEAPDLSGAVLARLETHPARRPALRVAVALATVLVVVLAIPSTRSQVAAWLGIDSLVITTVDDLEAAADGRVGVGAALVPLDDVAEIAGFQPALSGMLRLPDRVYASRDIVWMFHEPIDALPETDLPGVGAIVTQWSATAGIMDVKSLSVDSPDAELLLVNGEPAFWFETDHVVEITGVDGSVLERRSAGPTLIWLDGERVLRLETALDRTAAVRLAESFGD